MSCPACGHENPAGNRFCGGCGAALSATCPACAHVNPPDHRFCGACGAAVTHPSSVGDAEGARATADQAIRLAQERGTRGWEVRAHLAQARVLRLLDGVSAKAAIEASLARAEALIAETGACAQTPFVIEERARLAIDLGDARAGAQLLREARRAFEQMGAAGHAARLAKETGC
jgi:hypothetical protein